MIDMNDPVERGPRTGALQCSPLFLKRARQDARSDLDIMGCGSDPSGAMGRRFTFRD